MTTVTFQQAQALAALGYPQAQWPQMVWVYSPLTRAWTLQHCPHDNWGTVATIGYHAAPHPVDALVWAVERLEQQGDRTLSLEYKGAGAWQVWDTDHDRLLDGTEQCTAPDLLDAALRVLEVRA